MTPEKKQEVRNVFSTTLDNIKEFAVEEFQEVDAEKKQLFINVMDEVKNAFLSALEVMMNNVKEYRGAMALLEKESQEFLQVMLIVKVLPVLESLGDDLPVFFNAFQKAYELFKLQPEQGK